MRLLPLRTPAPSRGWVPSAGWPLARVGTTPARKAHDPEQVGGDHDRHHTPCATGIPFVGGYGPAMAAKEALTRDLSAELAPHGIRLVGLRPQAMPEARKITEAFGARQGRGNVPRSVAGVPRETVNVTMGSLND